MTLLTTVGYLDSGNCGVPGINDLGKRWFWQCFVDIIFIFLLLSHTRFDIVSCFFSRGMTHGVDEKSHLITYVVGRVLWTTVLCGIIFVRIFWLWLSWRLRKSSICILIRYSSSIPMLLYLFLILISVSFLLLFSFRRLHGCIQCLVINGFLLLAWEGVVSSYGMHSQVRSVFECATLWANVDGQHLAEDIRSWFQLVL